VSKSEELRKHELECLRMEAEALQLAREVRNPVLKSHFIQKAREWLDLSARCPGVKSEIGTFGKQGCPSGTALH
jgi:hypothetical protein